MSWHYSTFAGEFRFSTELAHELALNFWHKYVQNLTKYISMSFIPFYYKMSKSNTKRTFVQNYMRIVIWRHMMPTFPLSFSYFPAQNTNSLMTSLASYDGICWAMFISHMETQLSFRFEKMWAALTHDDSFEWCRFHFSNRKHKLRVNFKLLSKIQIIIYKIQIIIYKIICCQCPIDMPLKKLVISPSKHSFVLNFTRYWQAMIKLEFVNAFYWCLAVIIHFLGIFVQWMCGAPRIRHFSRDKVVVKFN